jgi:DNA ligase-1
VALVRRFEFRTAKSEKFWAIVRKGCEVTIAWGRIDTTGHRRAKTFARDVEAASWVVSQVRDKLAKGYVELGKRVVVERDDDDDDEDERDDEAPPARAKQSAKKAAAAKPAAAKPAAAKPDAAEPANPRMAAAKKAAAKQAAARQAAAAARDDHEDERDDEAVDDDASEVEAPAPAKPVAAAAPPAAAVASLQDIPEGGEVVVAGSGSSKYTLRNVGGAYSCTCPAWMHQSLPTERRTCKHLRKLRGDAAEEARVGSALPQRAISKAESASGTTNVPPLLLAHRWEEQDPTGWWLSEKLDGVRAYWDGKQFISRLGNAYLAPDWFIEHLPEFPLDGELFAGRGKFQQAVSIARRMDRGSGWRALSYVIFDAPALAHGFEDRIRHLEDHFGAKPAPLARVLEHRVCKGLSDLHEELRRVEDLGGEGVMLRRPGSRYVAGRSDTLLKVKTFLDTEARVIGHQDGTGKHAGRLGALLVELPNGTRFKVGTGLSDAERGDPPEVGAIVTVRYQELTDGGVPRFPSYVGVRVDIDWDALTSDPRKRT